MVALLCSLLAGASGCASTHDAASGDPGAGTAPPETTTGATTGRDAQVLLAEDAVGGAVGANERGATTGSAAATHALTPTATPPAPGPSIPPQARGSATPSTPGFTLGAGRAVDGSFAGLAACDLVPMTTAVERWRVVAGDGVGEEFERRRAPSSEPGASVSDRWGDDQTYELSVGADAEGAKGEPAGAIVMPLTIAHRDRAVTFFDPPLALAPTQLRAGSPLRSEAGMKVFDEGNRRKLQHSGRAARTLTLIDAVAIETPMGTFDALRVRVEFRATLQLATASEVATQYVVPGVGVVAEERVERVNAMGFINRTTKRTIVRVQ
jgi:hypothetical protein